MKINNQCTYTQSCRFKDIHPVNQCQHEHLVLEDLYPSPDSHVLVSTQYFLIKDEN